MEWIKASIQTTSEGVEPVMGVLISCGINGAQIIDASDLRRLLNEDNSQWDYIDEALLSDVTTEASVEFYVTPDVAGQETISMVQSQLNILMQSEMPFSLGCLSLSIESVNDETWLNEWKKYYKPFRIGKSVIVVPVWEQYKAEPGELVFTIDPGSVFGTGLHQTTQLCIEAMEKYIKPGDSMMDVGCGSGILSIIGLMLGVKKVLACDVDPAAAIASRDNALLNPVKPEALTVMTGNIFTDPSIIKAAEAHPVSIVIANIVADVVIKLTPLIKAFLKSEGLFIASGIIDERVDDVINKLNENGYRVQSKLNRDGWFCLVAVNA